jgi:hypothetical protein
MLLLYLLCNQAPREKRMQLRSVQINYCPAEVLKQLKGTLEAQMQTGEFESEAMMQMYTPEEFILNLFSEERPCDLFIDTLRDAMWDYARPYATYNLQRQVESILQEEF